MHIAVYCASTFGSSPAYADAAARLGSWIAERGHTLVYGGSNVGLMGVVADAALAGGGQVVGVLPAAARIQAVRHTGLTRYYEEESVSERKAKMIELSDAFVALPGGPGTLDEMAEVISLAKIGLLRKPCVLMDVEGFYRPLKNFYASMVDIGFASPEELSCVLFSDDFDEVAAFLEGNAVG